MSLELSCSAITHPLRSLTASLLLHAALAFLLPAPGLLHFLMLPTLVEVLHHDAHKHVQHEETDDEQKGYEVQQHPGVVVGNGLRTKESKIRKEQRTNSEIYFFTRHKYRLQTNKKLSMILSVCILHVYVHMHCMCCVCLYNKCFSLFQ